MRPDNESFMQELEKLQRVNKLRLAKILRLIGMSHDELSLIESNMADESLVAFYYEKLLSLSVVYDVLDRLWIAYQHLQKMYGFNSYLELAKEMKIKSDVIYRAFDGDTKCLNEDFIKKFNSTFGDIFDLEWLIYGNGTMFQDPHYYYYQYKFRCRKPAAKVATNALNVQKDYDLDPIERCRRRMFIKKAINPDYKSETIRKIKEYNHEIDGLWSRIERREKEIEENEKTLAAFFIMEVLDEIEKL
ncbi:MAG: hypothetical protein IKX31_05295 [Muribaculaceae bacterium]|nr:hypothetical protein [Muribaculaceae bacterium]MBR5086406.1 hypothetical protein [Muribaculaceae bacterium]